jgi:CBS domain-containing membrane protein
MDDVERVAHGLVERLGIPWLQAHHQHRAVVAAYCGISCMISIGVIALLALLSKTLFLFPPLGASAFLFFFSPSSPSASPRNAFLGYLVAIIAGYVALALTGAIYDVPAGTTVTGPHVLAVVLALGLAVVGMVLLGAPHPPAAATALGIALGMFPRPMQVLDLLIGLLALIAQAMIIYRVAGIPLGSSSKELAQNIGKSETE